MSQKEKKQHQELSQKAHVPPQQFHSLGNDIIMGVGATVEMGGSSQEELSLHYVVESGASGTADCRQLRRSLAAH